MEVVQWGWWECDDGISKVIKHCECGQNFHGNLSSCCLENAIWRTKLHHIVFSIIQALTTELCFLAGSKAQNKKALLCLAKFDRQIKINIA